MAIEEIRENRIQKAENLKKVGIDPYPAQCSRTHEIVEALTDFDNLENEKRDIVLAGRLMAFREHGGSTFGNIFDGTAKIQIYFKKDVVGEKEYDEMIKILDIGDFVEVQGFLFKTKRGEGTLEVKKYRVLTKSLLPMPEKWHGLQDVEERFRKRYLDLLFNSEVRENFIARFKIVQKIREIFLENGFLEVDTPILQSIYGGALANPFKTKLDILDLPLYLRIAPELYLKRLLVGGFDKVFEIGKNFRNEGMDREHNPEFSMLEAYIAYKDYNWLMNFTEDLLLKLVKDVFGRYEFEYEGQQIEFKKPFKRVEFNVLVNEYLGLDCEESSLKDFQKKADELKLRIEKSISKGALIDELFKKAIRPKIIEPTFVINHPWEISPLAKRIPDKPKFVQRFHLIIEGTELINAFSELNDPVDQLERFKEQEKAHDQGEQEAHRLDEEFVEALEYGMPPAAGMGLGIDRLVALLTNSHSLRDIILFPTMKPKE